MQSNKNLRRLVLASIFMALIVVMTLVPYTGYITSGPIEITTLHIPVIIGGIFLGWKYGALIGGVWGVTCMLRAFTNPLWAAFTNPLVSVVPRICVGLVAGLIFMLCKKKLNGIISGGIAAAAATLTNTVLVLSALYAFGHLPDLIQTFLTTIITTNFIIEIAAAVILVPAIYTALMRNRAGREIMEK